MAEPPPIPSDAVDDAARARDAAEEQARLLYLAALAYVATHDPAEDPAHDPKLMKAAATLALTLWRGMRRFSTSKVKLPTGRDRDARLDERAGVLLRRATEDARAHARTVEVRMRREDPDVSDRMVQSAVRSDRAWAAAAGRTMGTSESGDGAMELHGWVEAVTGEPHSKLWISRGDPKVRTSHRRLHGRTRPIGDSFLADHTLRFPADPKAPPEEAINCRCVLFLVPTAEKAEAERLFHVDDEDFDIGPVAAAAGVVVERALREWRSELARSYNR